MKGDFTRLTFRPANHYSSVRLQQGRVQVDADWNEQVDIQAHADRVTTADIMGRTGAPEVGGGFAVQELGFTGTLRGVSIVDDQGYAVADGGTVLDGISSGWAARQTKTSANLRAVHTTNGQDAWAVGDRGVVMAHIGYSAWDWQDTPVAASALRAVHFLADSKTGWAVGDRGTIIATTTGGANTQTKIGWAYQPAPDDLRVALRDVHFVDARTGWAVGDRATLIACREGAWRSVVRPAGVAAVTNLRSVQFVDPTHGWIVGDGGTVLLTTDGGANWTTRTNAESGLSGNLRAVSFVDASRGWAVGDKAAIFATTDGGLTWTRQTPPPGVTTTLRSVSFGRSTAAATIGVAAGDAGTLVWTQDAGRTWALLAPAGKGLAVSAGRFYVDGILCENDGPLRLTAQPDLPGMEEPPRVAGGGEHLRHLVYLDVWERHVTALERPDIREVALGGPDTATRTKVVAQVKWQELAPQEEPCGGAGWLPAGVSSGLMAARAAPAADADDICLIPPGGGYRRLENQLYRVEIHSTDSGVVTVKWSRENGSVLARLDRIDADRLAISAPGPDAVAAFDGASWVEVTDDERTHTIGHGDLVQLQSAQGGKLIPLDPASIGATGSNPVVRRWDGVGTMEKDWFELEGGVQVCFESTTATFRSGDYWLVPARSLTATVDWPRDEGGPLFQPAHGIEHHYAALAELRPSTTDAWAINDCRRRFTALTNLSVPRVVEPAVHVRSVSVRSRLEDRLVSNSRTVDIADIRHGIDIAFDRQAAPLPLSAACRLTLDIPFPLSPTDRSDWGGPVVGYQPLILDSTVLSDEESNSVTWQAREEAWVLVEKVLGLLAASKQPARVRAHLRLQGNFIWAADDPNAWLDGDTFGTRRDRYLEDVDLVETGGRIGGDGRRGGDFLMWFDIVRGA